MAKNRPAAGEGSSVWWFDPLRWFHFVEAEVFTRRWGEMGLTAEDLLALQDGLLWLPDAGAVVKGTGGLRKVRVAPPSGHAGKRGGVRVCYVFFKEFGVVLLVTAYAKGRKDDLTAAEKKQIRTYIERQERLLAGRK